MSAARKPSERYRALLLDPRWQKRRLEELQRAKFRCERCNADKKTLQVHHRWYDGNRKPWDYPAGALIVLCDDCHELQHLPEPTAADRKRESQILRLEVELKKSTSQSERRQIVEAMSSLVRDRTPDQVRRMERDRGLT